MIAARACTLLFVLGTCACGPGVSSGTPPGMDGGTQMTGTECDTTYTNPTADLVDLVVVVDRAADVDTNWLDVRARLRDGIVGYASNRGDKPTSLRVILGSNGGMWQHFDWESWHESPDAVRTQVSTQLTNVTTATAAPALLELAAQGVNDPTLVRESASRLIVFVTARDDQSATGTDYASALSMGATDIIVSLVGTSAPIADVQGQLASSQGAALTDATYDSAFYDFIVVMGQRCFMLAVDPAHPDCSVIDTTTTNGSTMTTTLPACGSGVSPPCFQFSEESKCDYPKLVLKIDRGSAGLAPPGTTTSVQCRCP